MCIRDRCSYAYSRIMVRIAQQTVATLRQDLFDKLQTLPLRYFDTHQSGDLMSRFTNDIDTVSEMITSSLASILSNVVTFVCTIAMMLYLNWVLTLITFAFLALMLLVVKTIGARSRVSFQRQQRALGGVNGYIEEMIEGQKVIKVFNYEDKAIGLSLIHILKILFTYFAARSASIRSLSASMPTSMAELVSSLMS